MEIDPYLQLAMLLGAFLSGAVLGGAWEMLTAVKILMGAYRPPAFMEARYARPLPLLHRAVPFAPKGVGRRLWQGLVAGVLDCLFCIVLAVVTELLLYAYNDGAFRLSVPVLVLLGLALLRFLASRLIRVPMAYFAYGVAAAMLYLGALLTLPARGLRRFVVIPLQKGVQGLVMRRAVRRSAQLCRLQLLWAAKGLEGECPRKDRKDRQESIISGSDGALLTKKKGRMRYAKKKIRG